MDRFDSVERLRAMQPRCVVAIESLRVELLDHAETAELALGAVPIALVVAVFRGELAAGDRVALGEIEGNGRFIARSPRRGETGA